MGRLWREATQRALLVTPPAGRPLEAGTMVPHEPRPYQSEHGK
jgi:hypothetical protein